MNDASQTACPICRSWGGFLRDVDGVAFHRCAGCGSLYAHPDFLDAVDRGTAANYGDRYWAEELAAARERSYGGSVARVAEALRLARIPVRNFLDIGTGPGFLLDSLTALLPNSAAMFHGVELLPPSEADRSRHPNYHVGSIGDLAGPFDGGICVEVIEHLTPAILRRLADELAARSTRGALYFFNSAQPSFVESTDPSYLDPKRRGHIVSWSIEGALAIFAPAGFNVIPLPGRDWAFLAEFGPPRTLSVEDLLNWLWHPVPDNIALSPRDAFAPLLATIGLESARCYLEAALAEGRGQWALGLERDLLALTNAPSVRSEIVRPAWLRRFRSRRSP